MVMSDLVGLMSLVTVFALGLAWLCYETEFLHVRLPVGKTTRHDFINIYEGAMPEFKPVVVQSTYLLPEKCEMTLLMEANNNRDNWEQWGTGYNTRRKSSYQQMKIGNNTVTLSATLPKLYEYIKEAQKAQTVKPHDGLAVAPYNQVPMFIEQVRTGSERTQHGMRGGRRYYENDDTYKTVYHDCLVSKEWLQEHEHDLDDFHPTIDISVNGQTLNVNGNYEINLIKSFMLKHTQRVRLPVHDFATGKVKKKMQTVCAETPEKELVGANA